MFGKFRCAAYRAIVLALVLLVISGSGMGASALWPAISERELMESSSLIVRGRVETRSEPFIVENTRGGMTAQFADFVDYSIEVHEVLRGETPGDEIVLRVQLFPEDPPGVVSFGIYRLALEVGGEYLLFLSLPGESLFDTPGYYYYPNWWFQGVFARQGEGLYGQRSFGGTFALEALRDELVDVNATVPPPTEEDNRQRMLEVLEQNMSGVLVWNEEYWQEAITRPERPGQIVAEEVVEEPQQNNVFMLPTGLALLGVVVIAFILRLNRRK